MNRSATTKKIWLQRSKKVYEPKLCAQCGKSFVPSPTMYKRQTHCSLKCGHAKSKYTDEQRVAAFWRKVDKSGLCWVWKASKDIWGYGRFKGRDRLGAAHRFSYELANGPIQAGMLVLHSCDNPPCVNPAHLRLGTDAENAADKKLRGGPLALVTRSKLNEDQVRHIKTLRGKEVQRSIAERYGVTESTVGSIFNGRTWKHL